MTQFDVNAERIVSNWIDRTGTVLTDAARQDLCRSVALNIATSAISASLDPAFVERAWAHVRPQAATAESAE
jgi:hypothetical protein